MVKKSLVICFLLIALLIQPASAQDYNLTESRNPFTSDRWFQGADRVILNDTLNAYTLNYTAGGSFEDFTTYTEIDTLNRITVIDANTARANGNLRDNSDTWLYKTQDIRGDFDHFFDLYVDSTDNVAVSRRGVVYSITNNTVLSWRDLWLNNYASTSIQVLSVSDPTHFYLSLDYTKNGALTSNQTTSNGLNIDTWYYIEVTRVGTTYTLNVFSDSGRTALVETVSLTVAESYTYSKIKALQNAGYASTTANIDVYVKYYNLAPGGYESQGWLYFKDLLENTTAPGIYYTSNQTIPAGSLSVAFSEDNSTWVYNSTLHPGIDIVYLEPGDLNPLYVRYRFDGNGITSPALLNASFMTLGSGSGPQGSTVYVYGFGIVLFIIAFLLGGRLNNG